MRKLQSKNDPKNKPDRGEVAQDNLMTEGGQGITLSGEKGIGSLQSLYVMAGIGIAIYLPR